MEITQHMLTQNHNWYHKKKTNNVQVCMEAPHSSLLRGKKASLFHFLIGCIYIGEARSPVDGTGMSFSSNSASVSNQGTT